MTSIDAEYDVATCDGLVAFYDDNVEEIYRAALRLTRYDRVQAEDLVQDTFVRLVRAARSGHVTRVGIGWMMTTLRRRHFDTLRSTRRERRRHRLFRQEQTHLPVFTEQPGSLELLDGLSKREQSALVLRYVDNLPVADVAHAMHTTIRATESLLQRAKKKAQKRAQTDD